jgi:hypothetical protein
MGQVLPVLVGAGRVDGVGDGRGKISGPLA